MNNILVVSVNWLGDVIFSAPVYQSLKDAYPKAKLSVLAVPRVQEVLDCIDSVDEIISFEEKGKHRSLLGKWRLSRQLHQKDFDAAFLLRPSRSRALILKAAGIPVRVGYVKTGQHSFLSHSVEEPGDWIHRADYYSKVIRSFGVEVKKKQPALSTDDQSRQEVTSLLSECGVGEKDRFIVINPGGNWHLKRWPPERFIELTQTLLERRPEKIVLTGASKDEKLGKDIAQAVGSDNLIDLTGETKLKTLVALMEKAFMVVSGDSGPLHIANSVGTKAVGIYGPTRPEVTGPRGKGKSRILQKDIGCNLKPCYFLDCPNNQCMQAITVKEVVHAVKRLAKK